MTNKPWVCNGAERTRCGNLARWPGIGLATALTMNIVNQSHEVSFVSSVTSEVNNGYIKVFHVHFGYFFLER